ncbi:zeta toxin family protein [Acinetobacter gyllenbergii]|uniref:zeta toxin family protein n=1 Tax=Acinetobacter gyllenbergii TaxID=134534 RepID=UPI003F55A778
MWADQERRKQMHLKQSFIVETVFSHPSKLDFLKTAKDQGYFVTLYHIHLDTPELALERIQNRVLLGGHHINEDKVRQRYERAITIIVEASMYADQTFVFDNSINNEPHSLVLELKNGIIHNVYRDLPKWVTLSYEKQLKAYYNVSQDSSLIENQITKNGDNMQFLKEKLGFEWNPDLIPKEIPTYHRAEVVKRLEQSLAEHVHGASTVAGNPYSLNEIKQLIKGESVGGHHISDQKQITNLINGVNFVAESVLNHTFRLDKTYYLEINRLISKDESIEAGVMRGEGKETVFTPYVAIRHNYSHKPIKTKEDAVKLNKQFSDGVALLNSMDNPLEKGIATFLFGSLNQFTFEGEKRTAHLMMNGILLSAGLDAIKIPAPKAIEFRNKMSDFYQTRNANKIMSFLLECYPDLKNIKIFQQKRELKSDGLMTRSF